MFPQGRDRKAALQAQEDASRSICQMSLPVLNDRRIQIQKDWQRKLKDRRKEVRTIRRAQGREREREEKRLKRRQEKEEAETERRVEKERERMAMEERVKELAPKIQAMEAIWNRLCSVARASTCEDVITYWRGDSKCVHSTEETAMEWQI